MLTVTFSLIHGEHALMTCTHKRESKRKGRIMKMSVLCKTQVDKEKHSAQKDAIWVEIEQRKDNFVLLLCYICFEFQPMCSCPATVCIWCSWQNECNSAELVMSGNESFTLRFIGDSSTNWEFFANESHPSTDWGVREKHTTPHVVMYLVPGEMHRNLVKITGTHFRL